MSADPAPTSSRRTRRGPVAQTVWIIGNKWRVSALSAQVSVDAAQIGQVFDHLGGRVIAPSINSASRLRSAKEANILFNYFTVNLSRFQTQSIITINRSRANRQFTDLHSPGEKMERLPWHLL